MKGLEQTITAAWQKKSVWLWLLLPLMLLYWLVSTVHKSLYTLGIKKSYKADIPVIVIGNITVGGSGKTPLLIALVEHLASKKIRVAVISRGYGGSNSHARLLPENAKSADFGDEPCLIQQATGVPVCVGSNRADNIQLIQKHFPNTQIILSDDGLQHYKLTYDMAWIVYDAARGLGNKMLLPVGFLREWGSRLRSPNSNEVVIHHGDDIQQHNFSLQTKPCIPLRVKHAAKNVTLTANKVHAVTGIGYPPRFFETLKALGFEIIEHPFPDHYSFQIEDLIFDDDLPILITSKDAVKIQHLPVDSLDIWILPVKAKLSDECYKTFDSYLETLI